MEHDEELKAAPETESVVETAATETEVVAPEPQVMEFSETEVLQKQLDEEKNKNLRLMADFQNYRKRVSKELSAARLQGLYETITPFIQVFDYFQMATKAANDSENITAIREGMKMIEREYQKALDELGVTKFDAVGQKFNPEQHDAVAHEESDAPENEIVKQWNCGYRIGERLIRPAKVVVSSGKKAENDGEK